MTHTPWSLTQALVACTAKEARRPEHTDVRVCAVVVALWDGPKTVGELGVCLGLSQATTSLWLRRAVSAGFVAKRGGVDGRTVEGFVTPIGFQRFERLRMLFAQDD